MKQTNLVGIDVGSRKLVVAVKVEAQTEAVVAEFDNHPSGYKKLAKFITKRGHAAKVCMEATGSYHLGIAMSLHASKKIEVMVVNPKFIKSHSISVKKRAKTDIVDAHVILDYLVRMDFVAWQPPSENILQIQAISRRMFQLKNEMTREANRQHANSYRDKEVRCIERDIEVNQNHLKKRIDLLEQSALDIIKSDAPLKSKFDLLVSVKGIAKTSAVQLLSELMVMPEDMQASQWVAFAGLDPKPFDSGTSINKPRRISKAGNRYLRTALYMPAWVAVKHDKHVKAFYDKLIGRGKEPMQAIVAVMRKLLLAIFGMWQSGAAWEGNKFYTIPNNA